MNRNIEAIFFDIGDTLRTTLPDPAAQTQAGARLKALLGANGADDARVEQLNERYRAYHQWRQQSLIELSEKELWTRWMLPDLPARRVEAMAEELTHLWRARGGRHRLRPDAPRVIAELSRRGYALGIISNTICAHDAPQMLSETGLARYFPAVLLSSDFGRRKPDPAIFLEATRRAGVRPERSAYVGDRPSRDVVGPQRAGFAMAIVIENPGGHSEEHANAALQPDALIRELGELLAIFSPRDLERGV